jgi:hypothetical protein
VSHDHSDVFSWYVNYHINQDKKLSICKNLYYTHLCPVTIAFVVIVNCIYYSHWGKNPIPSEGLHLLQQKAITHFKAIEHMTVYCSIQSWSRSYTSIKSPVTHVNVSPLQFEFLLAKVLWHSEYISHRITTMYFPSSKLSYKSGAEIMWIQIESALDLLLLHL